MAGELGVPNQPVDFPDTDRLDRVLAVIDAEAGLEFDRVLLDLIFYQENQFLRLQQRPKVQNLEIGAEVPPVRVVEIDVVLPAHPLAVPHIVTEVFQLILGVHVRRQHWLFRLTTGCRGSRCAPKVSVSTVKGI